MISINYETLKQVQGDWRRDPEINSG